MGLRGFLGDLEHLGDLPVREPPRHGDGPRLDAIRAAGFRVLRKPVRAARLRALLAAPR